MAPPLKPTVYTGTFIHTPTLGTLEVLQSAAIAVDEHGVIVSITRGVSMQDLEQEFRGKGKQWEICELGGNGGGEGEGEVGKWWCPGFVDTHIHAPQYPNSGIFGRTTLLTWLNKYTFPLESSLADLPTANRIYNRCVARTLSHGTTTAAYFATTHVAATNLLADICLAKGQRAFIGRVCMDSDLSPDYYRDASPQQAITDTEATITHIQKIDPHRTTISPVVTPRFAPSCSPSLLSRLGHLAQHHSLPIQTHISENPSECALVHSLFPTHANYAAVYDAHSLLTPRTVLAHAIHLSPAERRLIKERGCGISHCPVSNTSLSSGLCPVREFLDEGIPVGLGTDVSGGYSSSILVAAREAGMVSRVRAAVQRDGGVDVQEEEALKQGGNVAADVVGGLMDKLGLEKTEPAEEGGKGSASASAASAAGGPKDPNTTEHCPPNDSADRKKLTVEECLYMATLGGAKCLNLEHKIGSFAVGKQWDAQLIEIDVIDDKDSPMRGKCGADDDDNADERSEVEDQAMGLGQGLVEVWGNESWEDKVAKWIVCGDDRNTRCVFVGGRMVHRRRGGGGGV